MNEEYIQYRQDLIKLYKKESIQSENKESYNTLITICRVQLMSEELQDFAESVFGGNRERFYEFVKNNLELSDEGIENKLKEILK